MRGFTDDERERIREQLRETGRERFARFGLGKTTISELADGADIAASTFYQFYDSKEDLYLELLMDEREDVAERILGQSFEAHDDPRAAIEAFLHAVTTEIETNPFIRGVVVADELDRLRSRASESELAANRERSIAHFLPYVEAWYEAGEVRGPSPEVVAHAIRSIAFLTLHEEDIPEYQAVKETVIEAVARGLTTPEE